MNTTGNQQPKPREEPTGTIFDVKRYALHDGPGIRTTVFLKGCTLSCRWCHNPESWRPEVEHSFRAGRCTSCGRCVDACPQGAIGNSDRPGGVDPARCTLCGRCVEVCRGGARELVGRVVTVAELLAEIERDVAFFDESGGGATFSGGEPLMQADFMLAVLRECRRREIHTALDTTLHAPWEVIDQLRPWVDLFLCDVKQLDPAVHEQFTGVSNELILGNLRRLAGLGGEIIIRVPLVPGVNDDEDSIMALSRFVAELGGLRRIDLLPYHAAAKGKLVRLTGDHELMDVRPLAEERIRRIVGQLQQQGFAVKVGG
jgi:pyruvate formate lyase activating enzyme